MISIKIKAEPSMEVANFVTLSTVISTIVPWFQGFFSLTSKMPSIAPSTSSKSCFHIIRDAFLFMFHTIVLLSLRTS